MVELGWTEEQIANTSIAGLNKVYSYMTHKAEAEKRLSMSRKKKYESTKSRSIPNSQQT